MQVQHAQTGGTAEFLRRLGRATGPISRPISGRRFFPLYGAVHHVGRRSGTAYVTPVALRADGDYFVISLPWGSSTQWAKNVQAAAGCRIRWKGRWWLAVEPTMVGPEVALPAFNAVQRLMLRMVRTQIFLRLRRISEGDPN